MKEEEGKRRGKKLLGKRRGKKLLGKRSGKRRVGSSVPRGHVFKVLGRTGESSHEVKTQKRAREN